MTSTPPSQKASEPSPRTFGATINAPKCVLTCLALILLGTTSAYGAERSRAVRNAFVAANPCPIYDDKAKRCLAEVDHAEPLCAGGKDSIENLQWLSKEQHALKTKIDILRCARLRALKDVENGK